jgi:voltage-gated potassium channel
VSDPTDAPDGADDGDAGPRTRAFGRRRLIGSGGFKPGDDRSRVEAYQAKWQMPLDLLALVSLWFIVVPPSVITAKNDAYWVFLSLRVALSLVYATDITIRTYLAPHRIFYLRHNKLSVASVIFPFLRVLFSLRLLRSVFQRGSLGKFVLAATLMFLNLTIIVYLFERHAPGANIKSFGNAIWWAVVTVTTVGYGDYTPVTWQGRSAAVLLMFVGFAVLATITAQISSSFIDQAARARAKESGPPAATAGDGSDVGTQLAALTEQIARLEARLGGASPATDTE